jgi:hypothetical protein
MLDDVYNHLPGNPLIARYIVRNPWSLLRSLSRNVSGINYPLD